MIVTEIEIPAESFEYSEILQSGSNVEVELEQFVSFNDGYAPLIWVSGNDRGRIIRIARDHPLVDEVIQHQTAEDRTLVEVFLHPPQTGVLEALHQSNAKAFEVTGTADFWRFRLGFSTQNELTAFQSALSEFGIPMTLRNLSQVGLQLSNTGSDDRPSLSDEQHEALLLAKERGYFDVPRRVTTSDLADELGISDSAVSQRIRRALATVVNDSLSAQHSFVD